ncbi:hypothetical protein [Kitasatospora camelliae]|uniref:Uncharacterized protein n=1 Tax=Kitasatospora camelliae TaxID=3156397 RepID=A0AAU8JZA1_9ACTN
MELLEIEVERHDWASMRCGCGQPAEHLAQEFRRLALEDGPPMDGGELSDHVTTPGSLLLEPALPTVSVLLAALADEVPPPHRFGLLEALLFILSAEGQDPSLPRETDLVEQCEEAVRAGLWLLYREVLSGESVGAASYAFEILSLVESDRERLGRVRAAAGERISWDLRTAEG